MYVTHNMTDWMHLCKQNVICLIYVLAHVTRKLNLSLKFLIKICPQSVFVVVGNVEKFSHLHLLLNYHGNNFKQTLHKTFLGTKTIQVCLNEGVFSFSRGYVSDTVIIMNIYWLWNFFYTESFLIVGKR